MLPASFTPNVLFKSPSLKIIWEVEALSKSCLFSLLGISNKCCAYLHYKLVLVNWIFCAAYERIQVWLYIKIRFGFISKAGWKFQPKSPRHTNSISWNMFPLGVGVI